MNTKNQVDTLWQELRTAINKAYASAPTYYSLDTQNDLACLRDYAENISWSDDLAALLGRETANERQHRSNRPSPKGFSAGTAAKCILLNNVRSGAEKNEMPRATEYLVLRKTAVEAGVIGWIIREYLSPEWREAVNALDYSELMKGVK